MVSSKSSKLGNDKEIRPKHQAEISKKAEKLSYKNSWYKAISSKLLNKEIENNLDYLKL